jgi:hypothetical protein
MLYALMIGTMVFTTTPDLESCNVLRVYVIKDALTQITNRQKEHVPQVVEMVRCVPMPLV